MCLLESKAEEHVPYREFVGVTESQVTEASSTLDRIRLQFKVTRFSVIEKGDVMWQLTPNILKASATVWSA